MYSNLKKEEAIKLRKEGNSYAFIASKISVSKSTLSDWLKDVPFMPNELVLRNKLENINNLIRIKRADKMSSYLGVLEYGRKQISDLNQRDIFMLGLGVYIGEGSKTASQVRIVNSDPRTIRFATLWFRKSFELTEDNFRLRLHIYPDNDEHKAVNFWKNALGMKRQHIQRSYIDVRTDKKKNREGVLPYGTAHLGVCSNGNKDFGVLLHRKIIASIDFALDHISRD